MAVRLDRNDAFHFLHQEITLLLIGRGTVCLLLELTQMKVQTKLRSTWNWLPEIKSLKHQCHQIAFNNIYACFILHRKPFYQFNNHWRQYKLHLLPWICLILYYHHILKIMFVTTLYLLIIFLSVKQLTLVLSRFLRMQLLYPYQKP